MPVMRSFLATMPCLVLLASCVGAPVQRPAAAPAAPAPVARPAPARGPAPAPAAPAPLSTAWADRPVAPGSWTYRADAAGPVAMFGPAGSGARLTVRCDRAGRRILFARAGAGQGAMTVRTSYGAQVWPTSAASGSMPETVAARGASDGALDQIAYSRGKFAVEVLGLDPLILPAWAEVARVIEDCR